MITGSETLLIRENGISPEVNVGFVEVFFGKQPTRDPVPRLEELLLGGDAA